MPNGSGETYLMQIGLLFKGVQTQLVVAVSPRGFSLSAFPLSGFPLPRE